MRMTVLDPEVTNGSLYQSLQDNYLQPILQQPEYQNYQVTFSSIKTDLQDFILANLYDVDQDIFVEVEINRGDSPESISESFIQGLQTVKAEYAKGVQEMKNINHPEL